MDQSLELPESSAISPPPESAKTISFVLKDVIVMGASAFSQDQLRDIYAPYQGRRVTLDIAWKIANDITARYRNNGYFLSRAYVPAQKMEDGIIGIKVVEGYVAKVAVNQSAMPHTLPESVLKSMIRKLTARRPLSARDIESFLLRINDMPGVTFRAVLSKLNPVSGPPAPSPGSQRSTDDGGVLLTLVAAPVHGMAAVSFDNAGSRFLGPNEVTLTGQTSLLPLQQTQISVLSTAPANELKYVYFQHTALIAPALTFEVDGSFTQARPGFTLRELEIESRSNWMRASLNWQWLRQRDENLTLGLSFDGRNTNSDILESPLTRDRIRALRLNASYNLTDNWSGYNTAELTLSQGLNILGASEAGDPNLSRAGARPNFTTAQASVSRTQALPASFSIYGAVSGQMASNTLFSAEEMGYGGQAFGRAYDSSEITGDQGISGSVELRYSAYNQNPGYGFVPYTFYDLGGVWDKGHGTMGSMGHQSGSSAGFGLRFRVRKWLTGNLGLAFPLTRDITAPVNGESRHGPRPIFQITTTF